MKTKCIDTCIQHRKKIITSRTLNKDKTLKFKNRAPSGIQRIQARARMRRARIKQKPVSTNKAEFQEQWRRMTYCCGKRQRDCVCFSDGVGAGIAKSFKKQPFKRLMVAYNKSEIQTYRDTDDMSQYEAQMKHDTDYQIMFPYAFMWRTNF